MAVSETAKLISSLELQDKFSKTADTANRKLGTLEGATQRAGRQMGIMGHAVSTALGIGLARAVSGGVSFLTRQITDGVDSLNELESVVTASNTVIASTKGVAGQTADSIRNLSEKYETLNATIDDKVIQSGANLLLTFTNVRKEAFEPALEAALNMNEAMGGGAEGLQSTIIQLGKALNDPVKGATALRRVGVQLSEQQQKQIKTLVEQNDLYGAQQIILQELGTEFGGRFAAAGKTAEGQQARLRDSVEDLQKALAGPLIPAIDKARAKIIDLFSSDRAQAAAGRLGEAIAGIFTDENLDRGVAAIESGLDKISKFDFNKIGDGVNKVFGFLGEVPWGTISDGLKITGQAAKIAVDAFLALPKEVQGIVVAGLAVNKLSGGLAGSLAGGILGKGLDLFKGRGSTPATPLFVADVTGGGGIPGIGGKGGGLVGGAVGGGLRGAIAGGGLIGGLATGVAVASPVLAGIAAVEVVNFGNMRTEAIDGLESQIGDLPTATAEQTAASIARVKLALDPQGLNPLEAAIFATNVKPTLDAGLADLQQVQQQQAIAIQSGNVTAQREATITRNSTINEFRRGSNERRGQANHQAALAAQAVSFDRALLATANRQTAVNRQTSRQTALVAERVAEGRRATQTGFAATADRIGTGNARLATIASKDFSPTVRVSVTSNVTISEIQRRITSAQIAVGRGFLEGTG